MSKGSWLLLEKKKAIIKEANRQLQKEIKYRLVKSYFKNEYGEKIMRV